MTGAVLMQMMVHLSVECGGEQMDNDQRNWYNIRQLMLGSEFQVKKTEVEADAMKMVVSKTL